MTTGFQITPVALIAGLLTLSGTAYPRAEPIDLARVEATCTANISATNKGSTDIWVMLYDSEVKRKNVIGATYVQLKIQNHRVAPGATMHRTYEANGKCGQSRMWRIKLKRGTDFYTISTNTSGSNLSTSTSVPLGDLAARF